MDEITIVNHIREGHDLLSLPQTLSEILKESENPSFSADALSTIILRDPVMTGRILKVANSAFYSRFSNVRTVNQAVQLLGMNNVKCLALSTSIFRIEKIKRETGVDAKQLFASILMVATGAERIAQAIKHKHPEEVFVAGILHDIGIVYFLEYYPEQYRQIVDRKVKAISLLEAEKKVFGIDHCEVGFHLTTRWRLPEYVCNSVRSHHNFLSINDVDTIGRCVMLASLIAPGPISRYAEDIEERLIMHKRVAACLDLSPQQVDEVSTSMLSASVEIAQHIGVDIGTTEQLLTRANQEIWRAYSTIASLFKERQELTSKLLAEEHKKGALEAKNIAIATLSHYLNNATMAVYGRSQILRMMNDRGNVDALVKQLPGSLDVFDRSIRKIVAVIAEIKAITPIDDIEFLSASLALNLDDRIAFRLKEMENETGLVLPDEVEEVI